MNNVQKLVVALDFGTEEIEVGELVTADRTVFFRYNADFLKRGLDISPIHLPIRRLIVQGPPHPFEGLFGVFADSLPDGWGRLLLDRSLIEKGIALQNITPLDRLAYVGSGGMGALVYKPEVVSSKPNDYYIDLDGLDRAAQQIIVGTASDIMDQWLHLAGSSGGARPKILVGYHPVTGNLVPEAGILPEGYEHWLIKFPAATDRPDIAHVEFAYHQMALDAGLEMSKAQLFKGKSGKHYFGTQRFDREGNNRLHLHSAAGIMHDNFRLSNMDYGHLMDCAFLLEKDVRAYEKILRIAAFNVFAHNRDDHSKNFSFLMDRQGQWKLAPAYDLTFSYSGHGMHSTMVAGESSRPTRRHLMELARHFQVKEANTVIEAVRDTVQNWPNYAANAGVGQASKNEIWKAIAGMIKEK